LSSQTLTTTEEITRQLMRVSMGEKAAVLPFTEDIYLTTVHVAGMCFYDVEAILPKIKDGEALILRRNPNNKHDVYATEVHTSSGQILGHVPRSENKVLARLMDSGKRLTAMVENADGGRGWKSISIKIFMANI